MISRGILTVLLATQMGAVAVAQPLHPAFRPPITARKIRIAIDDAVLHLRTQQQENGSISDYDNSGGGTALAALAMLAAGVDPVSDKQLQKALDFLAPLEPNNTYIRGLRANVWEYALRKAPHEKKYRDLLNKDFDWLIAALGDREGWRYNMESRDWDNSCTQYGVLGIWAATRAGFDPGEKFWKTMSTHFRTCQNADGGWGYAPGGGSSSNMATAGLASLFLVFDTFHGKSFYSAQNPRTFEDGEAAEVLKSIERGMQWLGQAQDNKSDGYYLYGIERTGVASGRKSIGTEDWFAKGAMTVLSSQQSDGSIPLCQWGNHYGTPLCTLFLVYGGAPVALNKLQYETGQDWNLNPRDLANLSKELWSAYERPVNWQTVSIDAQGAEFEAPILFISGTKAVKFDENQMLKLREYILRGGTILAEPSDHSPAFADSMKSLLKEMFDKREYPGIELQPIPADHPIYTVIKQNWKQRPKLLGASDGSRIIFLLSEEYLSADWQMNRTDSDAFRLAMNLLFYVTDLGELPGKFTSILPDTEPALATKKVFHIARGQFQSQADVPRDWDAAGMTWTAMAPYVLHVTGHELKEQSPVKLEQAALKNLHLLHLCGRQRLRLTDEERSAIKAYVDEGGTVFVDAFAGSQGFADSAKQELEAVFGKLEPLSREDVLSEGRFAGGVDLSQEAQYKLPARLLLRKRQQATRGQHLLVAKNENRPAVIFSEFDLSAALAGQTPYQALGYKPESARKVVTNIVAYLLAD